MKKYLILLRSLVIRKILGINGKIETNNEYVLIKNDKVSYSASPVLLNRSQYRKSIDKINSETSV